MGRTLIVGDVHGCARELEALLSRLAFTDGDRLIFVGDLVARGPDALGVLSVVRRTKAVFVRGNHEDKLLRWWTGTMAQLRGDAEPPRAPAGLGAPPVLGPAHASVAEA